MENLILLHGALGGADQLLPLKEKLNSQFNIHILEFDGHGKKSDHATKYSLDGFVIQLDTLIHEIGEDVHIFGYSMGGFVAMISASRGNENIKSITTLGTKMRWSPEIASSEVRHLDADKIKEKVPKFFEALQYRHGDHWIEVLDRTANFMKSLGEKNPMKEAASKVKCPVQLVLADQDQMVSKEETEDVNNWIPHSQFQTLSNSHHPIEKVNLSALQDYIISFIRS
ncbi:MAG: alpha/beta fold hydrolase [Bacteroidota bacterium]